MKSLMKLVALGGILLSFGGILHAQENSAAPSPQRTPLKITIILHEYSGKDEVGSLPYEVAVTARAKDNTRSSGRVGTRIPVLTEKGSFTYMDIGTNYDCVVTQQDDGRFRIETTLDRSSVSTSDSRDTKARGVPAESPENPRVNSLRLSFDVLLRDGETIDASSATDPLTGHVWKVEVRLKVLK
jgi:hypothetical protein